MDSGCQNSAQLTQSSTPSVEDASAVTPEKNATSAMNGDVTLHEFRTVPGRIKFFSTKFPDKEAFVFYNRDRRVALEWRKLYKLASRFAWRLHKYGFQKYDVIANTLPNSPERVVTDLGIMFAGCTPLNGQITTLDNDDFYRSARQSRCKAVIVCSQEDDQAWSLLRRDVSGSTSGMFVKISNDHAPELTSAIVISRPVKSSKYPLLDELDSDDCDEFFADLDTKDLMYVFATSGTSGYTKLVPRSHEWLVRMFDASNVSYSSLEMYITQTAFSDRPLGWLGGIPAACYGRGEKRVVLDSLYEPLAAAEKAQLAWTAVCQEQCQQASFTPPEFSEIYKHVQAQPGSSFKPRLISTGGQPVRASQISNMLELCDGVFMTYGSTETGLISSALLKDATGGDFFCGSPVVKANVRVVNKNNLDCKPGEMGHVWARGPVVFDGYFNRLEPTTEQASPVVTSDGWFDTGDNGYFDEKGDLYITGRETSAINHGPQVVYPEWLEQKLTSHQDVAEAIVVPVSDPVLFHAICACVKPEEDTPVTEETLRENCRHLFLTDSKYQTSIHPTFYLILHELPETPSGKIDRNRLKQMAEDRFGKVKEI